MKINIYDLLVQIFCFLWVLSEIILNKVKHIKKENAEKIDDKFSLLLIWISIFLSVLISIFFKEILEIGNYFSENLIYISIGFLIMMIGILIRYHAVFTLKEAFTVNVARVNNHKIIKKGLYKYIRHPAYLGILISCFGLGICFRNIYSLFTFIIIVSSAIFYRISIEEKFMEKEFGKEYDDYKKTTKKLLFKIF